MYMYVCTCIYEHECPVFAATGVLALHIYVFIHVHIFVYICIHSCTYDSYIYVDYRYDIMSMDIDYSDASWKGVKFYSLNRDGSGLSTAAHTKAIRSVYTTPNHAYVCVLTSELCCHTAKYKTANWV